MRLFFLICCFSVAGFVSQAQVKTSATPANTADRPKLVVGIVIDQMRWDYLYRYYDRYAATGGFKRFLHQGFSCENTLIPYTPTITACGHTCIFTGSVPAIHGIVGNNWWDNELMRTVYCTEDKTVTGVGAQSDEGQMSPKNMLVTSVCDELRLATNFRSKVIGIAIKDRGGILPAGHSANAAYWYDSKSGNWISSTYYMNDLPEWVKKINAAKMVDKYYEQGWNTLYPINTYVQSTADEKPYEGKSFGADQKGFPYDLKRFVGKNYGTICSTPYGNTMTAEMAKAAVTNEQLGADNITDFLTVSFSSTDYIGHAFGPNSIEQEDDFLRLDKELGDFFTFLDTKVGKGQYLVFLSADHGAAHVPGFMQENKLPAGLISNSGMAKDLRTLLQQKYGSDRLIAATNNYQIYLNHDVIDSLKLNDADIKKTIVDVLSKKEGVARVFAISDLMTVPLNGKTRNMFVNGYYPRRSGDIQVVFQPGWIDGGATGTTHGLWNPYDSHIPLLFYGWKIKNGKTNRETHMTDIAATVAAMLRIQMPSGSVGDVIEEVMQ
ncbi:MAG: alkaline phosphatase family protein [Chitinophagaceae bacterium]